MTKSDELTVTSTKDLAKGEELTINYGFFSNDHFLLLYGFLPAERLNSAAPMHTAEKDDLVSPHDTCLVPFEPNAFELAADLAGYVY